jgi:CRISPR/Cas system CSM-associated protein Csm3 (group 7 of RAMP superfamily)
MTRYAMTVTPHSSLFIGGYAHAHGESDGDTARDATSMLIPGSALKGALREAAFRLVNAAGCGHETLRDLFGEAEEEGALRIGPLRPVEDAPDLSLRHHVSLQRATRQAADQRLFQNRVTAAGYGLRFRGELTTSRPLSGDEQGLLESARQLTDQLGGGRGRGLGLVSIDLEQIPVPPFEKGGLGGISSEPGTIVLTLTAEEPLQLGIVKDLSNVATSKGYLDGSAVRGAVAAALERLGHHDALDVVLGGDHPAQFGDAHPGHLSAVPAPLTLREPKAGGAPSDDAVALCAHAAGGRPSSRRHGYRAAKGSFALDGGGWQEVTIERRMVTRTARNLVDGRAADGLLFSLEVIEPHGLCFYVPVTGRPEQLEWVVQAAGADLFVGGTRSRGFGRLRLADVLTESPLAPLAERHQRWIECLRTLAVDRPETTGALLAVGPIAVDQDRLLRAFERHSLELIHGVSRRQAHGGWNRRKRLPREVGSCFVPGSTFIVQHRNGESALDALAAIEAEGIGPGRPDGWGRLIACHPIHVDCFKENQG